MPQSVGEDQSGGAETAQPDRLTDGRTDRPDKQSRTTSSFTKFCFSVGSGGGGGSDICAAAVAGDCLFCDAGNPSVGGGVGGGEGNSWGQETNEDRPTDGRKSRKNFHLQHTTAAKVDRAPQRILFRPPSSPTSSILCRFGGGEANVKSLVSACPFQIRAASSLGGNGIMASACSAEPRAGGTRWECRRASEAAAATGGEVIKFSTRPFAHGLAPGGGGGGGAPI